MGNKTPESCVNNEMEWGEGKVQKNKPTNLKFGFSKRKKASRKLLVRGVIIWHIWHNTDLLDLHIIRIPDDWIIIKCQLIKKLFFTSYYTNKLKIFVSVTEFIPSLSTPIFWKYLSQWRQWHLHQIDFKALVLNVVLCLDPWHYINGTKSLPPAA